MVKGYSNPRKFKHGMAWKKWMLGSRSSPWNGLEEVDAGIQE
jgi:hypothetical protein